MGEKPCGLVGHLQDAVELVRATALFGAAQEINGLQELMQRDAAMLEYGANLDRELLAAFLLLAFPHANASSLALELRGGADRAAMWADRTIRPQRPFEVLECRRLA